jgi:hypothetical protein
MRILSDLALILIRGLVPSIILLVVAIALARHARPRVRRHHADPQGAINRALVPSIILFVVAMVLPAEEIEGRVLPGFGAFFIGYFCAGVVFWPSHLLGLCGWINLSRRKPEAALICGVGALYGPALALSATRSFPAGWVWLVSLLVLVAGCLSLSSPGPDRELPDRPPKPDAGPDPMI